LGAALDRYIVILENGTNDGANDGTPASQVRGCHEEVRAEMNSRISGFVSWMDAHQAKTEANREDWMATMKASQERMEALMDISLKTTEACVENIEANQGKIETRRGLSVVQPVASPYSD
jgi:predicted amidohydrolase